MNDTAKLLILSAGAFGVVTAANIVSKSIYTNSKLGVDRRALIVGSTIGIGITYAMMKHYKN